MELRQLEYFVSIADTRSFTRAADRCSVVQPALSQQVRRLESELGTQLFVRTTRSVALTDAGEALLPVARRILADVTMARSEVDAVTGLVRGRLALGAIQFIPRLDLPRLLASFRHVYPGVDIVLRTEANERMLADVHAGVLDLAFVSFRPEKPPLDLGRLELLTESLVVVVPADHRLAARGRATLRQLAGEAFIELSAGSGVRGQSDQAFAAQGLERHIAYEVGELHDALALATLGLGVTLLPHSVVSARVGVAPEGAVRALELDDKVIRRTVALVWRDNQPVSSSGKAFLAAVRAMLASEEA